MATSWDHGPDEEAAARPRRVGYRAATLLATLAGTAGEAAIHLTEPGSRVTSTWRGARVPLLAALVLAVAQVPLARRTEHRTVRPERSELARHLARRMRGD